MRQRFPALQVAVSGGVYFLDQRSRRGVNSSSPNANK
jgi:hypothetical protein